MTYEYICTACGHQWEADQSIKDPALKDCPSCHKASAKRQVSGGTGFVLKGGGWYADLYSSSKGAEAKRTEADSASTSDASSSTTAAASSSESTSSTETKTESKPEKSVAKPKASKPAKTASE
jgi:putative FmdB family regulatory protein